MRIHRESFLVAVTAIAAGCGATTTPTPAPAPLVIAPATATLPPPAPAPTETGQTSPTNETGGPISPVAEGGDKPGPSTEGGPPPTREGYVSPSAEGTANAWQPQCRETGTVVRPAICDDALGAPDDCNKAFCRSLPFVCQHCQDYKRYFKPRIAERAVACVIAQTQREADDGCRTYRCGDLALKAACIDPAADALCASIARSCKTSMDECRGALSGMNDAGRQRIASCAAHGCPYGLWSCVEGI